MARDVRQHGLFYPGGDAAAEAERRAASPNPGGDVHIEISGAPGRGATLLRLAGWGTLLALVGQWLAGFGVFFWPKKVGAFGGEVIGGNVPTEGRRGQDDQEGKFYVSRVPEGFLALWWKCPHLGCTVPWKPDDPSMDPLGAKGRFNCPCHGSIYDRYGDIISGPAPRPMDLFASRSATAKSMSTRTRPRRCNGRQVKRSE